MHPVICRILTGFILSKNKRKLFRKKYLTCDDNDCFNKFNFRKKEFC